MNKENKTLSDKFELNQKTKGLVISLISFVIVICIFLYLSLGWFNSNSQNTADGMKVGIIGIVDKSFDVYKAVYVTQNDVTTEQWVKIEGIDITTMVANETRRYMIVCPTAFSSCSIKISSMNANSSTVDPDTVTDYFYINPASDYTFNRIINDSQNNIIYTSGTFTPLLNVENYTYSQLEPLSFTNKLNAFNTISYSQTDNRVFVFDVYTDEDVCNCFDNWSCTGEVTIK